MSPSPSPLSFQNKACIQEKETYGSASLQMVFSNRVSVVHSVKSSHFINTHRRHFKNPCNLVHDGQGAETVLALAEIEKGHDGGFFVLGWVALEDFIHELVVLFRELERDGGIVFGSVTVLQNSSSDTIEGIEQLELWGSWQIMWRDVRSLPRRETRWLLGRWRRTSGFGIVELLCVLGAELRGRGRG